MIFPKKTPTWMPLRLQFNNCDSLAFIKGNPNFQEILNWILQILHYYCRKQHKNIKKSKIIEQNLVFFSPFSLFTAICASCCPTHWQNFFIFWKKYFANLKHHKWSVKEKDSKERYCTNFGSSLWQVFYKNYKRCP